jgi:hypothetical protein
MRLLQPHCKQYTAFFWYRELKNRELGAMKVALQNLCLSRNTGESRYPVAIEKLHPDLRQYAYIDTLYLEPIQ